MSFEPEPIDMDIRVLLDDVARIEATADAAIVARMRDRIDIALIASTAAEPAVRPAPTLRARLPLRRALAFAGAFAGGAVVALAAERLLVPAPNVSSPPVVAPALERILESDAAAVVPARSTTLDALPSAAAAASDRGSERRSYPPLRAATSAHGSTQPTPPPEEGARDEDLSAEARLIDTARSALAHGDFRAALVAAKNHERRFPAGRLAEEREAILIQSLAGVHQDAEARSRADAFRARYPHSFFLPLVDRAVTSAL